VKRRLIWPWPGDGAARTIPRRPFRDSAIFNGVLALLVVGLALLTGGSLPWAVVVAAVFFVLATTWSWMVWRRRLRSAAEQQGKQ
jgi:membrane protein implicated in regulation of membrane protease activity